MADITAQMTKVYQDGNCSRTVLYSVKNATAADTVDVAADLRVVKRAGVVSDTGTTIASATNTGTAVTVPTGPANDGVWLLVVGVAA